MGLTQKQLSWRCNQCGSVSLTITNQVITCTECSNAYHLDRGIWECAPGFLPAGFGEDRSAELVDIEQQHFWFEARDRLLARRLSKLRSNNDQRLLELGCGSGRFLGRVAGDYSLAVGLEGHMSALQRATSSNTHTTLIHADVTRTPLADARFDCVVALDVLEHVEPLAFLREAWRLTRPGGKLLVSVPAFPFLWSHVDELAGHRCRYRLSTLQAELRGSGWLYQGHTYFQFLLFPLLAVSRLLGRKQQSTLEKKPPAPINYLLDKINRLEVLLFNRVTLPFGSSLVAWATKPGGEKNER